jgi:hypothetical protein
MLFQNMGTLHGILSQKIVASTRVALYCVYKKLLLKGVHM